MKDRMELEDRTRSGRFDSRSRVLFEIGLWLYAVASGIIVTRTIVLALDVSGEIWIVKFVRTLTGPIVDILQRLPGGDATIVGAMTLADVTLLVFVGIVPLMLIAFGRPSAGRKQL
jgi:hypothetical protein